MACLATPPIPKPTLGGGLSIPAIPALPALDARLCCKLASFEPTIVSPIPIASLAVVGAALDVALAALETYYDLLPVDCPL